MDDGKTCFFIGNRHAPSSIKAQLSEVVEKHITKYGVNTFTVGHYGSFDYMVQGVLRELKKHHMHIGLYLLAPYALTQKREIPEGFNGSFYPEGLEAVPLRYAIVQANKYMCKRTHGLIICSTWFDYFGQHKFEILNK